VAMDGGMPNVRGEGWKGLRVGGLGRIARPSARNPVTGDVLDLARTGANSHGAHLGGPAIFGQPVWALAKARRRSQAADTVVLGDGAACPTVLDPWVREIWSLARDPFSDCVRMVDWYQAKQHRAPVASPRHGKARPPPNNGSKTTQPPCLETTPSGWRAGSIVTPKANARPPKRCLPRPVPFVTTNAECSTSNAA